MGKRSIFSERALLRRKIIAKHDASLEKVRLIPDKPDLTYNTAYESAKTGSKEDRTCEAI